MDDDKNITAAVIRKLAEAQADADEVSVNIQRLIHIVILFGLLTLWFMGYSVYLSSTLCVCAGS